MINVIQVDVGANLWWSATASRDGGWVARCDALKLTAQAETWAELMSVIDEVQTEMMIDLLEEGELETFLSRNGWRLLGPIPADAPTKGVRFDIPFQVRRAAGSDAHAA